ncbi:sel1 repeat family protein [Henriciella mobilis]|uniref:tetratricopeptide repeat protein n=1 Tax=Henriciella mobilis TaxID=2305467 RepID=UPI000E660246|nr:sel1 repeat family protein [Henriciella mobilis]RIJ16069.1 sel1 repeat family protein [Henriciella mobilis]RIJ23020.1 sel1 repeat family protein [Henriciella mobilis]
MTPRLLILLLTVIAAISLAPAASAQFGREQVASPDADELYADRAVKRGWYDDARERYKAACEDESRQTAVWARNCRKLADLDRKGLGAQQDYDAAQALYDRACFEGRDADSCMQQAYTSFKGLDGNEDLPYARKLYKQACDLDHARGCAGYGSMLYRGQGGDMRRDEGKQLIQQACADGDTWACERARGYGFPDRRGL